VSRDYSTIGLSLPGTSKGIVSQDYSTLGLSLRGTSKGIVSRDYSTLGLSLHGTFKGIVSLYTGHLRRVLNEIIQLPDGKSKGGIDYQADSTWDI